MATINNDYISHASCIARPTCLVPRRVLEDRVRESNVVSPQGFMAKAPPSPASFLFLWSIARYLLDRSQLRSQETSRNEVVSQKKSKFRINRVDSWNG